MPKRYSHFSINIVCKDMKKKRTMQIFSEKKEKYRQESLSDYFKKIIRKHIQAHISHAVCVVSRPTSSGG